MLMSIFHFTFSLEHCCDDKYRQTKLYHRKHLKRTKTKRCTQADGLDTNGAATWQKDGEEAYNLPSTYLDFNW